MLQIGAAAVLVILAAIIAWRVLAPGGNQAPAEPTIDLDPNRIAVVPFANRTGDASLDNLAGLTADRLTQGLADLNEIEVAPASVVAATTPGSTHRSWPRRWRRARDPGWSSPGCGTPSATASRSRPPSKTLS